MRWGILSFILLFPSASFAAVLLSEVAWMGSTDSANYEWIELHNTESAAVDVSGWEVSDGMNLSIPLSGTIPANSYAVLERTSDASAAGSAFLIYTGALVNTGATLVLKRSDGGLEDQVAGGADWKNIGGDNVTKETAQYTSAGWVTGVGTPGVANSGSIQEPDEEDDITAPVSSTTATATNNSSRNKSSSQGETVRLILPGNTLSLKIDSQTVGYVNQTIDFVVDPSGVGDTISDSLSYAWNFGNGEVAQGEDVTHAFSFPGTYVVTVHGSFARQEQVARHEITILPVTVSVTKNTTGDIQINNDSPYELDISGYRIQAAKTFIFPPYSVILPNQTITIPQKKIGGGVVTIFDSLQARLASLSLLQQNTKPVIVPVAPQHVVSTPIHSAVLKSTPQRISQTDPLGPFSFVSTAVAEESDQKDAVIVATATQLAAAPHGSLPPNSWPYLALIGLILLGIVGVVLKPSRN